MSMLTIAAGLVTGTVATVGTVIGVTAPPDSESPEPIGCGERLPQELREDLAAVPDLPEDQRLTELKEIRRDALAGEYGDEVQRVAERRTERREERRERIVPRLPEDLRVDLAELKDLPDAEQAAAYRELRDAALDGEYGDRVQRVVERRIERREAWREECRAG